MADFLIHLLDASQPEVLEFYQTTRKVLAELGADEKRTLIVFNKIDKVTEESTLAVHRRNFPGALFISVRTGEGLDELIARMGERADEGSMSCRLSVPQSEGALLATIHRLGRILQTEYVGENVELVVILPARLAETCEMYVVKDGER